MTKKVLLIASLFILNFFITPRPVVAKTGTFDVYTVATADAYVTNTTTNGTGDYFQVGNSSGTFYESYLNFSITPPPSQWFSAVISFYIYSISDTINNSAPLNITVSFINTSWTEEAINWTNRPIGTPIGNISITSAGIHEINVTDYINQSENGISIRLNATDFNQMGWMKGYTKEGYPPLYEELQAPQLIWKYSSELVISVFQPHGESVLDFGYQTIRWNSVTEHDNVIIELYKGNSFIKVIVDKTDDDGAYMEWRIYSSDGYDGDYYRIKITDYYDDAVFGWSDYFAISITPAPPDDSPWMGAELFVISVSLAIAGVVVIGVVIKKIRGRSRDDFDVYNDFNMEL